MLEQILIQVNSFLWGWPLILFFVFVGTKATIDLKFFQFRHFGTAWKKLLGVSEQEKNKDAEVSPVQAFLNVLSASIGNGSLAGMSTAIYSGGPGAAFWVFIIGFFGLIVRFCEVYLSDMKTEKIGGVVLGGPMIYLQRLPFGRYLSHFYAFFMLMHVFFMGDAMQANSIRLGLERMAGINPYIVTVSVVFFISYLVFGGAARILKVSDFIVPIKVGVYFLSVSYVLIYHYQSIIPALKLILQSAFTPQAVAGGALGYTMTSAIRYGVSRTLNATESGIGTAGVLFGSTGSNKPVESGLVAITTSFVSNYLVCFALMLVIIASGVWNSGQTSTDLTISAFQTAFGSWGGWVVTFLSIVFGMGVLVSYAFIGREAWKYLSKGKFLSLYSFLYIAFAAYGSLASVGAIWQLGDVVVAGMTFINILGIFWLLPEIKRGVNEWKKTQR